MLGHVNEYPTIHYFTIPRHTQSIIAYKILTEYFWKCKLKNCIVGMLLTCPIHHFGITKSTQSMMAYQILTEHF